MLRLAPSLTGLTRSSQAYSMPYTMWQQAEQQSRGSIHVHTMVWTNELNIMFYMSCVKYHVKYMCK